MNFFANRHSYIFFFQAYTVYNKSKQAGVKTDNSSEMPVLQSNISMSHIPEDMSRQVSEYCIYCNSKNKNK